MDTADAASLPRSGSSYLAAATGWQPSELPGFWIRNLLVDPAASATTMLMKIDPGGIAHVAYEFKGKGRSLLHPTLIDSTPPVLRDFVSCAPESTLPSLRPGRVHHAHSNGPPPWSRFARPCIPFWKQLRFKQ